MKTIRLTMAQALVKFLNNQYISIDGEEQLFVEGVFTLFGHGNVLGLGQALQQDSGHLKVYQGHNEQGMANAAIAFAKQNCCHKIMACTSSVGPGAANMITSAALATANNIPVLILPGDVHATRQPDPVLQQIEQINDLSVSTNDAFKPVCRYWDRIQRPEQIMSACISAMRALTDAGNRGAVCLALPQDVQGEAYDYPESFFKKRVYELERTPASEKDIYKAVELLKKKKKPVFICGGGVKYSLANETIKQLAEKMCIPILETQAGKSAVKSSFKYNLGGVGITGNSAANHMAREADCVIAVGTRLTDFTTGSRTLYENPDVDFISINMSKFHAMKYDSLILQGDAKTVLKQLEKASEGIFFNNENEICTLKNNWEQEYTRLAGISYNDDNFRPECSGQNEEHLDEFYKLHEGALTQTQALCFINNNIEDDAIVVGASGSLPGCMQKIWKSKTENTYNMEYGYSCMGYEIAGGLGAKMAFPDKEVYVLVGDGAYLMLHSELITSLQINRKINVILFDNGGFGCINNLQMSNGMDSYYTEFRNKDTDKYIPIDFAQCARGYGVKTYSVKNMDELKKSLDDSKKQKISTLIDIKVLPKTMTHGYNCWWNVGVAEISNNKKINKAYKEKCEMFKKAKKY